MVKDLIAQLTAMEKGGHIDPEAHQRLLDTLDGKPQPQRDRHENLFDQPRNQNPNPFFDDPLPEPIQSFGGLNDYLSECMDPEDRRLS